VVNTSSSQKIVLRARRIAGLPSPDEDTAEGDSSFPEFGI
jgi:hypothetical protein